MARRVSVMLLCVGLAAGPVALADAAIAVLRATQSDFAKAVTRLRVFDRNQGRPTEVGGNAGDMTSLTLTDSDVGCVYTSTTDVFTDDDHPLDPTRNSVKLTVTAFHVSGHTIGTVFLPNDAPPVMKAHEQAHVDLNAYAYDKLSVRAADFSRKMLRKRFEGRTVDAAKARINDAFRADPNGPFDHWRDVLHSAQNQIDGNGQDPTVTPQQAYRQVLAENG